MRPIETYSLSSSTEKTTTEGVITPSEAKIVNGDTDVTDNYDITYMEGVMTVTKAEAEVVLDNGDDEAPATTEETTETPTTGDKINIGVIVMLMIDSALAGLYLTLRRRLTK